jgi:hypothetical protein
MHCSLHLGSLTPIRLIAGGLPKRRVSLNKKSHFTFFLPIRFIAGGLPKGVRH